MDIYLPHFREPLFVTAILSPGSQSKRKKDLLRSAAQEMTIIMIYKNMNKKEL
jgi:hypothetical protein